MKLVTMKLYVLVLASCCALGTADVPWNSSGVEQNAKRGNNNANDIPAATEEQVKKMCANYICGYHTPPEIIVSDHYRELPIMLQYLKRNRCKLVGKHISFMTHGPKLMRIVRIGDNHAFEYDGNRRLILTPEYRTYMTQNTTEVHFNPMEALERIEDGFFESYFPNVNVLHLKTYSSRPLTLPKLHLGFLPKLKNVGIDYPINGDFKGCTLPAGETACFAENLSFAYSDNYHKRPLELRLVDFHLPRRVEHFSMSFESSALKDNGYLTRKTFKKVIFVAKSTSQLKGVSFQGSVVAEPFYFRGGRADEISSFGDHLDGILHNPTIAKQWEWRWEHRATLRVPVVFGGKAKQALENAQIDELESAHCFLGNDIMKYHNEFFSELKRKDPNNPRVLKRVLVARAFYIDITKFIDRIQSLSFDSVEVTAAHLHISASRNFRKPLSVSYMKVTTVKSSAIFNEYSPHYLIRSRGSSATQVQWRDSVDAVFMQAIRMCTATLEAEERSLSNVGEDKISVGRELWMYNFPTAFVGNDEQVSKAQQMTVKVGELMGHWKEAEYQKAMRVPYLSMQHYREDMTIMLNIAENIVSEKRERNLIQNLQDVKADILDKQDRSTISLLRTEYKRTVSLVLISIRNAYDIEKKLNSTIDLVKEVNATFYEYKANMERENVTFMAGVRRAKAFAYAEVAAAITSSIVSFFSGGFNPGKIAKAAKKVKDLAVRLRKIMKLSNIFSKLARLIKTLRNIQELSRQASSAIVGRIGRLFKTIKSFREKRGKHLTRLLKKSDSFLVKGPYLLKKQQQNERRMKKLTKILKRIKRTRQRVEAVNDIMQGIVEAEKAKIALANAYEEGQVQDVREDADQKVTNKDIEEALKNEYKISAGDHQDQMEALTRTMKDYDLTQSKKVVEEGEKLNAADVLEWDAANANIESTMDASLSMDIPETTNFKSALIQMNLAGKYKTQAMIDEAALRVDLDRARFETTTYFKEGAAILQRIEKFEESLKKRKDGRENVNSPEFKEIYNQRSQEERLRLAWREFYVKLSIMVGALRYCNAYRFFHLSECPPEHSFDLETNLKDIIYQQRQMQRQSLMQLEDLYPPPQTMQNRSMVFMEPNTTCQCVLRVQKSRAFATLYADWNNCVYQGNPPADANSEESKLRLELLARECAINKVTEMQNLRRLTVPIAIDNDIADDHSRVRVDEVEVLLHGAKTNNGIIKLTIETSGLSQDRYKGAIYDFYGDKWRRDFSYYSPQALKSNNDAGNTKLLVTEWNILNLADTYKSFRSIFRKPAMFTTWVIKIDPAKNPGLDLSKMHKIELRFSGSFVASQGYKKNRRIQIPAESDDGVGREMIPGNNDFSYKDEDKDDDYDESCSENENWYSRL